LRNADGVNQSRVERQELVAAKPDLVILEYRRKALRFSMAIACPNSVVLNGALSPRLKRARA
jgi:hypothetical protein